MANSTCTECKQENVSIVRRYKHRRFCRKCYHRFFKPDTCNRCNKLARIPTFIINAICKECERDVPCIRCGKEEYETGKITDYGPVCKSCANIFLKKKPCEICGLISNKVSKYSVLKHNLSVCPKCYRDSHFGTCHSCHRSRVLQEDKNGNMVCELCATIGKVECNSCGEMKPAGYGKRCEECYWKELLEKRVSMNILAFKSEVMGLHYKSFANWMAIRKGNGFAAIKINKFLKFFKEIEDRWGDIPKYPLLLKHFTANKLRLVRLPMFWFQEELKMVVDEKLKQSFTEELRVKKMRDSFSKNSINSNIINDYYKFLMNKVNTGKSTIRSVRLAMRPAVSLLNLVSEDNPRFPTQKDVDRYLVMTPGQKNGITGFINFLNKNSGSNIVAQIDLKKAEKYKKHKLKLYIHELMKVDDNSPEFKRKWEIACLEYFHNLPKNIVYKVLKQESINVNEGINYFWNDQVYFIPHK